VTNLKEEEGNSVHSLLNHELVIKHDEIVLERLGNEIVIISFNSGRYYSAKGLATDILLLIQNKVPAAKWELKLGKYYSSEVLDKNKIRSFLATLIENNICVSVEELEESNYELPIDLQRELFDEPTIKIYDDLQDIIMVDPIHDTSLEGWPEKNEE
jgi:hypothetical protein